MGELNLVHKKMKGVAKLIIIGMFMIGIPLSLYADNPLYEIETHNFGGSVKNSKALESWIVNHYFLDSSVEYIILEDKKTEGAYYSKPLDERAKFDTASTDIIYVKGRYPEVILDTIMPEMNNWLEYDGRKLPMGMIVNNSKMGVASNDTYFALGLHTRILQYGIFAQNMKLGYIDTDTPLIDYPSSGILYKYLEIYNSDKSGSKMELYKKIQAYNDERPNKEFFEEWSNWEREQVENPEELIELARERDFIQNMSITKLRALIEKIQKGYTMQLYPDASEWARLPIGRMLDEGLADDTFTTNLKRQLTREEFAMLAVKLWEKVNNKAYEYKHKSPFVDVYDTKYEDYIHKAYHLGITDGIDEAKFGIGLYITREQICKMIADTLAVIENVEGYKSDINSTDISDKTDVSAWARNYVSYSYKSGIMQGVGNKRIAPKDYVTAEQTLTLIYRLAVNKGYIK